MNKDRIERKLEESYKHIKPYLNHKNEVGILHEMCGRCEKYVGNDHDFAECRNEPCFICFLGFEYMCWEDSFEGGV